MTNLSQFLWRPQQITEKTASPLIGKEANGNEGNADLSMVPLAKVEVAPETRLASLTDPNGPAADRFRYLRMRLRELKSIAKLQSLVVTSALPKDGKSTIAANLATVLAEGGKRKVLLIDADLHHPTVAASLGIASQKGLAECLEQDLDPVAGMERLEPLSWYLLHAGEAHENPTELLQSDALPALLGRLSPMFDWIVVDTPPVTPLTDALSVARHVDASLLVVRADTTPRSLVDEALSRLGPKRALGIVFNGAESLNRLYSQYYGHYRKK